MSTRLFWSAQRFARWVTFILRKIGPALNCSQQGLWIILIELDKISDRNTAAEFSGCNFEALWAPHADSGLLHSRERSDWQSRYLPKSANQTKTVSMDNNTTVNTTNTQLNIGMLSMHLCPSYGQMNKRTLKKKKKKIYTCTYMSAEHKYFEYFIFEKSFTWLWKSSVGEK